MKFSDRYFKSVTVRHISQIMWCVFEMSGPFIVSYIPKDFSGSHFLLRIFYALVYHYGVFILPAFLAWREKWTHLSLDRSAAPRARGIYVYVDVYFHVWRGDVTWRVRDVGWLRDASDTTRLSNTWPDDVCQSAVRVALIERFWISKLVSVQSSNR